MSYKPLILKEEETGTICTDCTATPCPKTTDSRHGDGVAPNLLARHCDVEAPNVAWCGDVTYVWTEEGWLYTSVLLDRYSSKGVEWAMSDQMGTPLVRDALEIALGRRQPAAGLIHHRDRGSQYASHAYRELLADHGSECSLSGKGDCLDNAVAERFFGRVKRERTSKRYYWTRQAARTDIIDYIEMFYSHSAPLCTIVKHFWKLPRKIDEQRLITGPFCLLQLVVSE